MGVRGGLRGQSDQGVASAWQRFIFMAALLAGINVIVELRNRFEVLVVYLCFAFCLWSEATMSRKLV